jgi:C1A family cysteine protease
MRFHHAVATRHGRHAAKRQNNKRRLSLELLETRTLLSVTTAGDEAVELNPVTHTEVFAATAVQSSTASESASAMDLQSTPSSYDLRSYGDVSAVKNQGNYGTCWAFASYASLESSLLRASNTSSDLSERNLAYRHGFDWGYDAGGNSYITEAYLSRFAGPISESDDPYRNMGTADSVTGPVQYYVREMLRFDTRSEIKSALMTYGAVYTFMYWTSSSFRDSDSTYYYNGSGSNHAVAIVGWDDSKATAGGTGAWLVKNSWGTGWGDGGYFWLSYQDSGGRWAESFGSAVPAATYSQAYYYDTFGDVSEINTPYAMNKYVAASASQLKSVGFYTEADNASYTISVYDTYSGGTLSNLMGTVSGTQRYAGYHTVDLASVVSLYAGNDFYVSLRITNGGDYPMAVDYRCSGYDSASSAAAGQSYYSYNGTTWTDLTTWNSTANYCIKALVEANMTPPEISSAVVAEAAAPKNGILESNDALIVTWVATSANRIARQTVTVDGQVFSTINGPYSSLYYSCSIDRWAAGDHTYTIRTTDGSGLVSSVTGTFTVVASPVTGPTVASVVVAEAAAPKNGTLESSDTLYVTWAATSANGIARQTVSIDGRAFSTINGPYSGRFYSCTIGRWAAGSHSYTIVSTDRYGVSSTATGTFTVVAPLVIKPTVASVVVAEAAAPKNGIIEANESLIITWAATSPKGIASQSVTVDGRRLGTIYGPYSSLYYLCPIGRWAAGSHSYTIVSTDKGGGSSTATGAFTVVAVAARAVNASSARSNYPDIAQLAAIAVQSDLQSRSQWGSQSRTAMADDLRIEIAEAASATPIESAGGSMWRDGTASSVGRSAAAATAESVESLARTASLLTAASSAAAALRADLLATVMHEMRETESPGDVSLDLIASDLPMATCGVPGSLF